MKNKIILFTIVAFAALTVYNVTPIQTAKADTGLEYWYAWAGIDPETNSTIPGQAKSEEETQAHMSIGSCWCDGEANCRWMDGTPCTERIVCSSGACVKMILDAANLVVSVVKLVNG